MEEEKLKHKITAMRDFILMLQSLWIYIKSYYELNYPIPPLGTDWLITLWERNYKVGSWKDKYDLHISQSGLMVDHYYVGKTVGVQMNLLTPIDDDQMITVFVFAEDKDNETELSELAKRMVNHIDKIGEKISDKEFVQKIKESFNII